MPGQHGGNRGGRREPATEGACMPFAYPLYVCLMGIPYMYAAAVESQQQKVLVLFWCFVVMFCCDVLL